MFNDCAGSMEKTSLRWAMIQSTYSQKNGHCNCSGPRVTRIPNQRNQPSPFRGHLLVSTELAVARIPVMQLSVNNFMYVLKDETQSGYLPAIKIVLPKLMEDTCRLSVYPRATVLHLTRPPLKAAFLASKGSVLKSELVAITIVKRYVKRKRNL